jgi:hypothetical protein
MPVTSPPYINISGLFIQSDKHVSDSLADYDGSARPGQLVVDSSDYTLYVGNSDGRLNAISSGGGSGSNYSNSNVAAYLPTYGGTISTNIITGPTTGNGRLNLNVTNGNSIIANASGGGAIGLFSGNSQIFVNNDTPGAGIIAPTIALTPTNGGDIIFDLNFSNADFFIDTISGSWQFNNDGNLYGINANANIVGNIQSNNLIVTSNVFLSGVREQTTGNTPLVMIDRTESGNVGYDSTIYYNHTTETLQIGNLSLSDTPAATGISISTAEAGDNGTMFFTVAAGSVISFTGDRRVAWSLLPYANIPNPAAGSIIYNNDSANAANGFYLCSDQGVNRVWEKVMAAKNTVVQLPGNTTAPTAVAGGVYYNSTNKAFYMCANVSLGWQVVNLT